jgi:WD40 repeat protein
MKPTSQTGAAFITTGTLTGAGISSTIGGIGLAGSFGGVGIGAASVYGAFKGITEGDTLVFSAIGIGATGGIGVSGIIGNIGFVAPKIGLAFGIGTLPMAGIGAAYGVAKLLDDSEFQETPMQLFERMEAKILEMDDYNAAVIELDLFLSGDDINQKFAALEIDHKLEQLQSKVSSNSPKIETKTLSISNQLPQNWQYVKTIKGHLGNINAIAIHPDGNTLISGSDDRQMNLWNLQTGKLLYTFSGQAEAVLSVAISPDGKQVISGSVDRKISSWQLATKKYNRTFSYLNSPYSHNGFVNALVYSPNGNIIVSASMDKTIRIWGSYTGTVKHTLNGHTDAVLSIAISSDNTTLVSGSADKTIRIWNLQTGETRYIINQHLAAVNTLAIAKRDLVIAPDHQTLISGSADGIIKFWNLYTGELNYTLEAHLTAISALAIHPDGKIIASSSQDGTIKLWHIQTGELLENLSGFCPLAFSADGKLFISGGKGGTIKIWRQVHNSADLPPLTGEWWEILDVEPKTHPKDVKLAYLRLARLYHPDINPTVSAKTAMQAVNQAYRHIKSFNSN